ncbi:glycosyltransferase [Candidatus Nanosynbacter featherlites]|uniref:Glycosyltransferase family 4 protein n=1 Tax=Candidatus Nanosynbacter featherlites TaxID=2572088 RepID=A0A4P9A2U0_9BACT|nr:glycosyltransferase [Candidatus Nanosynbacter featherlites]QCT42110.1 glycosyltransferase family 4 protein [Candidatus Nanosynbacter featherlites]
MRIGLFTDTYRPSINGIVFVVESLKRELENLGHEVYVFCPAKSMSPSKQAELLNEDSDSRIIRFPSIKGAFFDDYDTSVFFPPAVQRRIKELELDMVHVFTPSQIGLVGVKAAKKNNIPLVIQHCTDIYEFVDHYPAVLPGALALAGIVFPMSVRLRGHDLLEIAKLYKPRAGVTKWNKDIIESVITILYSKADAVIALCRKSCKQLKSWQYDDYQYELVLMPNGVNALPRPTKAEVKAFREQWNLAEDDEIFGFVGRLGEEKNLPLLIKSFERHIAKKRPKAKLLFVGDFEYRKTLEEMAAATKYADRIIFTGAMPREKLGLAYSVLDVFAFPSLKDTQGWVLHEAAHAGLPIVLVDKELSEVVQDGVNGFIANDNPTSFGRSIIALLEDANKRQEFGAVSKKLAAKFTESRQVKKLEKLYQELIDQKVADESHDPDLGA